MEEERPGGRRWGTSRGGAEETNLLQNASQFRLSAECNLHIAGVG